ncbi:MAG: hypothetical protein H6R10_3180, partial [Rhodocyclaceae bacterium]|nr:hypothetical protein [Rhodocyclaceae bacterium]
DPVDTLRRLCRKNPCRKRTGTGKTGFSTASLGSMAISHMPAKIDIWSRGEVASYLAELENTGQIKPCKHLMLEYGHASAFYPRCEKKWASRIAARNVPLDITAYSGPSSYSWPKCPEDCPHFLQAENFLVSVSRDQYTQEEVKPNTPHFEETLVMQVSQVAPVSAKADLPVPERVTLRWLFQHVHVSLWVSAAGLLCAVFVAGVQSSRLSIVREVFGLPSESLIATTSPSAAAKTEPNPSLKGTAVGKQASAP